MLYKYEFVKQKKLRELNFHFLFFMRKIRVLDKKKSFVPNLYFHSSFINSSGEIAPRGVVNKGIQNRFKLFFDDFKKLDQISKKEFYDLVVFSKDIHQYFEDVNFDQIHLLRTENINRILKNSDSFRNLMDSLWKYLKSPNAWEIDKHYEEFYGKLPNSKMCPFCGLNEISNQELFKADYDHIAYKADYPISSINLKNLAPSCADCNRNFKKAKDVFYKNDIRRPFFYPYVFKRNFQNQNLEFDLTGSIIPNTDLSNIKGKWIVNIIPINDFIATWDEIYSIRARYSLYVKHEKWLQEFTQPLKIQNVNFKTLADLKDYLSKYKEIFDPKKNLYTEYHIKYSYFNYLELSINDLLFNQINKMCA